MHASTTYFHKKHDFQPIFIEKSNMPTIFSSQSASWDWLPTSFAPTTLKSQMPTTRNQQQHKKRPLRSVWTLVLRFPNYGNSDTCVWRHSPQNSHGKKRRPPFHQNRCPAISASHWVFCQKSWKRKSASCTPSVDFWQSACLNEADQVTILQDQVAPRHQAGQLRDFQFFLCHSTKMPLSCLAAAPTPGPPRQFTSTPRAQFWISGLQLDFLFFRYFFGFAYVFKDFRFVLKGRLLAHAMAHTWLGIQGPLGPLLGLVLEVMTVSKKSCNCIAYAMILRICR